MGIVHEINRETPWNVAQKVPSSCHGGRTPPQSACTSSMGEFFGSKKMPIELGNMKSATK